MRQPPASLTLLANLPSTSAYPARLRLVGRVHSFNPKNCTTLLIDQGIGLLVDITLATGNDAVEADIGNGEGSYRPQKKDLVMITGELDWNITKVSVTEAVPKGVEVNEGIILRAHLILPCEDLDLAEWRKTVSTLQKII